MNRIRLPITKMAHFDLLHAARRVYKLRLKRCNMASLEEAIFGEKREDDLPGAMVPQRYFEYLKNHDFNLLEDVLKHNFDDVKNLARIAGHLCSIFSSPELLKYPEDLFSVGKTLQRGGYAQKARTCFRILGHSTLSSQAHLHLAMSYKKEKDWQEVVSSCQNMLVRGEGGIWPYIELAKYYEHIARNPEKALQYANAALCHLLNTMPINGIDEMQNTQIRKRIARLRRKIICHSGKNKQEEINDELHGKYDRQQSAGCAWEK